MDIKVANETGREAEDYCSRQGQDGRLEVLKRICFRKWFCYEEIELMESPNCWLRLRKSVRRKRDGEEE